MFAAPETKFSKFDFTVDFNLRAAGRYNPRSSGVAADRTVQGRERLLGVIVGGKRRYVLCERDLVYFITARMINQ